MADGWIKLWRKLDDNPYLQDADTLGVFTRMLLKAAFKKGTVKTSAGIVTLERGQCWVSHRKWANSMGISKKRFGTILKLLEKGTVIGTATGTGVTIVTLCNYSQYQDGNLEGGHQRGQVGGREGDTRGTHIEEGKELKEKKEYKFAGKTIRLTEADFNKWAEAYHAIPDLKAELQRMDDYYTGEGVKAWFQRASNYLAKKHQANVASKKSTDRYNDVSMKAWRMDLIYFRDHGQWVGQGPSPDRPGCEAPPELMAEVLEASNSGRVKHG